MPLKQSVAMTRSFLNGTVGVMFFMMAISQGWAQSVPEKMRINLNPAKPGIRSITIDRKYKPIVERDDNGVLINTSGQNNTPPACDAELEITMQNSRILRRKANLCSGNTLVVQVEQDQKPGSTKVIQGENRETSIQKNISNLKKPKGELEAVTVKEGLDNSDPASADQNQNETPTKSIITVQPSENRSWTSKPGSEAGARSTLVHGVEGTNDQDFTAVCTTQSGEASIILPQASTVTSENVTETVSVIAGDYSAAYTAMGSSPNNAYGRSFPQISLSLTDPLWEALISQSVLTVQIQGTPVYEVSLKGSSDSVRLFVASCSAPATIIGEEGLGLQASGDIACSEEGYVQSQPGNEPGQIVFRNNTQTAMDVSWIDYNGGEQPYARLQPGQVLDQQTYLNNAWMVRNAMGQCAGIYLSQTPYREITLSQSSSTEQPIPPESLKQQPGTSIYAGQVIDYICSADVDLRVTFSSDGNYVTVDEMGFGSISIPGSGTQNNISYRENGYEFSGQINNMMWIRPEVPEVFCSPR